MYRPDNNWLTAGRFSVLRAYSAGFGNILAASRLANPSTTASISLNKRFSRGFETFATYTWSHAIDDAPEQNNIDSANSSCRIRPTVGEIAATL